MSQFAELLAQLEAQQAEQETLAKALPAEGGEDDDKAIQAAAAEGDTDADDENPEDGDDDPSVDDQPMAKSMAATIDGEEVEVIDATELLKSLDGRIGGMETVLAKALESTLGTVKTQGEMIKSLSARLDKLAGQGKGRKAVLTISEKPAAGETTLAKSEPHGLNPQEFMLKANAAFAAGKLSGQELTTADVAIRMNQPIPAGIIAKALS